MAWMKPHTHTNANFLLNWECFWIVCFLFLSQIIPKTSAVVKFTLASQFQTFKLASTTLKYCWGTFKHLLKMSNSPKVPKWQINTIKPNKHIICWLTRVLMHHPCPLSLKGSFITLNCPSISCLCLQPAREKTEGEKKTPTPGT